MAGGKGAFGGSWLFCPTTTSRVPSRHSTTVKGCNYCCCTLTSLEGTSPSTSVVCLLFCWWIYPTITWVLPFRGHWRIVTSCKLWIWATIIWRHASSFLQGTTIYKKWKVWMDLTLFCKPGFSSIIEVVAQKPRSNRSCQWNVCSNIVMGVCILSLECSSEAAATLSKIKDSILIYGEHTRFLLKCKIWVTSSCQGWCNHPSTLSIFLWRVGSGVACHHPKKKALPVPYMV